MTRVELQGMERFAALRGREFVEFAGLLCAYAMAWLRIQFLKGEQQRKQRVDRELEAYACLDLRVSHADDLQKLSEQVCQVVAKKSSFYRVGMLARAMERHLYVAGSVGIDEEIVSELNGWGQHATKIPQPETEISFVVVLDSGVRVIIVPLRTTAGRMLGALAVCADGMMSVRRRTLDEALMPLETLSIKLERIMESAALAEKLLQAEKLAGLGMLADGMMHALSNPLTSVLGFAELIAGTAEEARVKDDAGMIVREALRMRETMSALSEFWQPPVRREVLVEIVQLLQEMVTECREELDSRGIRIMLPTDEDSALVLGNRERLRQVFEHLLNRAAQSLDALPGAEGREIRLVVVKNDADVHVIVEDTGAVFREPQRVFDPLSPVPLRDAGVGMGMRLCYGIVREHGGEISAINLEHGVAVVVELPLFAEKSFVEVETVGHVVSD